MAGKSGLDEYIVRVPMMPPERSFSVLKFNGNLGVDVTQWNSVSLERENNAAVYADESRGPDAGAGSEFGRKAREEARRRKLGREKKQYKSSDQPWMLTVHGKQDRKYKGTREGGVTDHADYWIFVKSTDGVFDAIPVSEWYNFLPVARYKTLDAEEAEEKFSRRNQILNQFAIMKKPGEEEESEANRMQRPTKSDDLGGKRNNLSDEENDDFKADKTKRSAVKKRGKGKPKKTKSEDKGSGEDIASGDSDDGDEEGREVDYMSDSESSSDSEVGETSKVDKALIGVADEEGLKALLSDNEEEEETENKDMITTELTPEDENEESGNEEFIDASPRQKKTTENEESSDSEDPDREEIKLSLFKSLDETSRDSSGSTKASTKLTAASSSTSISDMDRKGGLKRKEESASTCSLAKKMKTQGEKSTSQPQGITEEEVKRYLQRKPHSTKDLVAKFKGRTGKMSKSEIVQKLAQTLKKLNPEQYKKNDVLYFTMKSD